MGGIWRWCCGVRWRLGFVLLSILVSIDQLAQTLIVGPWWLLTGSGRRPDPNETISGLLGRHAAWNWAWAKALALLVDALFFVLTLGMETNHCERVFIDEEPRRTPYRTPGGG